MFICRWCMTNVPPMTLYTHIPCLRIFLTAVEYRLQTLQRDWIIAVTDAGQTKPAQSTKPTTSPLPRNTPLSALSWCL